MVKELEKIDYEDYKFNSYKNAFLIQCKKCGECQQIKEINNIWRGFCGTCKTVIIADSKLTRNAKKIHWQDYEYYLRIKKLNIKIYKI